MIDKVFPFESTNEAMAYVEAGRAKGKVVVNALIICSLAVASLLPIDHVPRICLHAMTSCPHFLEILMKIENAVVLVTGANRGIGLAFCRALLARGARKVYAGARDPASVTLPGVQALRLDVEPAGRRRGRRPAGVGCDAGDQQRRHCAAGRLSGGRTAKTSRGASSRRTSSPCCA